MIVLKNRLLSVNSLLVDSSRNLPLSRSSFRFQFSRIFSGFSFGYLKLDKRPRKVIAVSHVAPFSTFKNRENSFIEADAALPEFSEHLPSEIGYFDSVELVGSHSFWGFKYVNQLGF